ncbi:hypothetical protein P9209_16730 [Prescottella defluvii]|nr:hypothetical protein P9209_16730 [Prescottella defluvii]
MLVAAAGDFKKYFHELVVEAQQDGTLIAGDVREIGPLVWVLLHGLSLSNHLVADQQCSSDTGYEADDMPRLLALALQNLSPR